MASRLSRAYRQDPRISALKHLLLLAGKQRLEYRGLYSEQSRRLRRSLYLNLNLNLGLHLNPSLHRALFLNSSLNLNLNL